MKKRLSHFLPPAKFGKIVENFKKVKIGVIGDLMLDKFVWGEVKRISPEAPVPVVEVIKEDCALGGAGNVALNIKSLGGEVFLTSSVGEDENGKVIADLLKVRGIENYLFTRKDLPTITKTRVIARTQQVVRIDREKKQPFSVSHLQEMDEIMGGRLKNYNGLLISDYGKGFITPGLIKVLRNFVKKHKKILTVDPKVEHFSYYKEVTCLTPNKFEASLGIHHKEPGNTEELIKLGNGIKKKLKCENLLITLGKEGMILFDKKNRVLRIPATAREVFDVTGAGDTVTAVLTLSLGAGASILESAIISNFAAGVVVGKLGTASLTGRELKQYFNKNNAGVFLEELK